jgi:hypothetical protein
LFAVNCIKTVLHATKVAAGLNGTEFGQNAIDLFLTKHPNHIRNPLTRAAAGKANEAYWKAAHTKPFGFF